jgi:hypothetical protein
MHRHRITLALVLAAAALLAGCRSATPVPDLAGPLAGVVVRAAFEEPGDAVAGPLMLDSVSFARLGLAVGAAPFAESELRSQVERPFVLVDARDVLVCPERQPCRVADDGTYLEIWEAERTGNAAELVVTRVQNVRGLHVLTRAVTHRMTVAEVQGGWRLVRLKRLPT